MKLSVVMACYNGADLIGTQLTALANQSYAGAWELIVSDNGSTDRTVGVVQQYAKCLDELRVVDSSQKRSPGYARNVGASASSGDALLFVDHDDEVSRDYLAAMSRALSNHDFVAGRLEITKLNAPWVQKARSPHPQTKGLIPYSYPPFHSHAAGCALGVKRHVFDLVGGMDERCAVLEDTDLCFKAQIRGIPLRFVPDAVVHYRFRHTLTGLFRQAQSYSEGNVRLYKEYRAHGMPKLKLRQGLVLWKKLIRSSMGIRNKADLAKWLWEFGWRFGRVKGSLKYRVVAL